MGDNTNNTNSTDNKISNLERRDALKMIATSSVAVPILGASAVAAEAPKTVDAPAARSEEASKAKRSLTDPDLLNPSLAWNLLLSEQELLNLKALANIIIPKDETSPGAGDLDAQDFINEWVSAPYPQQKKDLLTVRGGLVWLRGEAQDRYKKDFEDLSDKQARAICNDIKWEETAKPEFKSGARFFAKARDLTATAFYTTDEGMADIGYIGNVPLARFDGPPLEVLKKLGLEKYADTSS